MARLVTRQPATPPRLITFAEAATRASNSPAWWRKLAARNQIQAVKLGRSCRLREEDVSRIIAEGFRPAQPRGYSAMAELDRRPQRRG